MGLKRSQVDTIRTTPKAGSSSLKAVACDPSVAADVNSYNEISEQIKQLEATKSAHSQAVLNFYKPFFANNAVKGDCGNFNIVTDESKVQFQTQNRSKEVPEAVANEFEAEFGKAAADDLIEVNIGQFKVDPDLANDPRFDKIYADIKALEKKYGRKILTEPGLTVSKDVVVKAAAHAAGDAEKYKSILEKLQVIQFIKAGG